MADEDGFEYDGTFYPYRMGVTGKDLMLLDKFSNGMPLDDFMEMAEEGRDRIPVMLTMFATSLRAAHPDWTVERIIRLVQDAELTDFKHIPADTPEATPGPPDGNGKTGENSVLPSKSTFSEAAPAPFATSNATQD